MPQVLNLGPLTRVEGHLEIQVTLDQVNRKLTVVDAKSSGMMFRGFEPMLQGRSPRDATHLTARICGVCPISHATAAALALDQAASITVPTNGRLERNLILGANFLQSHILHFYHLLAPDFVDVASVVNMSPWTPRFQSADMLTGSDAAPLVTHYVQALAIRRQAHQLGAIFGGRMPCSPTIVPGGCTNMVTADQVTQAKALLATIAQFITDVYLPDVNAVGAKFAQYSTIGKGYGNLLAYGVFEQNASGSSKLLKRGRFIVGNGSTRTSSSDDGESDDGGGSSSSGSSGQVLTMDQTQIREFVGHSYFTAASGNKTLANGVTVPQLNKSGAYSWIKAPRYANVPYEVGPLARMWVNGDYRKGPSVLDRIIARALETKKVADAMAAWLTALTADGVSYTDKAITNGTGVGLTEAPRGTLGHWVRVANGKVAQYQVLTPTAWNASPRDDNNQVGAIEKALIGTPVADAKNAVEVLRVVHSFDPCLSCAVHMVRPGGKAEVVIRT